MDLLCEILREPAFAEAELERELVVDARPAEHDHDVLAKAAPLEQLDEALSYGGLSARTADKTIENVIGTYAMPFALGLNVLVGYAGLTSLGHAGLFAITCYAVALMVAAGYDHLTAALTAIDEPRLRPLAYQPPSAARFTVRLPKV